MKAKKTRIRLRSRKGMTLLELLVGITIIVLVFTSTLGAMVGGFKTTIYNADDNKVAVLNSSTNEVLMNTVRKMQFREKSEVLQEITKIKNMQNYTGGGTPPAGSVIHSSIIASVPEARFVEAKYDSTKKTYSVEFNMDQKAKESSYQYTIFPETKTKLKRSKPATKTEVEVDGITIKTCFMSSSGPLIYETFVAFKN